MEQLCGHTGPGAAEKNKHPPLGSASHNFIKPRAEADVYLLNGETKSGERSPWAALLRGGRINKTQQSNNHLQPYSMPKKRTPKVIFSRDFRERAAGSKSFLKEKKKEGKVSLGRRGTGIPGRGIPACFPAGPGCWPTSEVGCEHKTFPLLLHPAPIPAWLIEKLKLTLHSSRGRGFSFKVFQVVFLCLCFPLFNWKWLQGRWLKCFT